MPRRPPGPGAGALAGRTVALKIGCPRPDMKDNWGDYHFAAALAAAFLRRGVPARIDFAAEPERHAGPMSTWCCAAGSASSRSPAR